MNGTGPGGQRQTVLDFAVSRSPVIFYTAEVGGEWPINFISDNVERLTGHKSADFRSDPRYCRTCIHPDDLNHYDRRLEQLRPDGSVSHEYRFKTTDGAYRWYRDEISLVCDTTGTRRHQTRSASDGQRKP